jgi:hypothetical protein
MVFAVSDSMLFVATANISLAKKQAGAGALHNFSCNVEMIEDNISMLHY